MIDGLVEKPIDKPYGICYTLFHKKRSHGSTKTPENLGKDAPVRGGGTHMILYDEIYFEINAEGRKADLKKFAKFLCSGELDDFFQITKDYICYDDDYAEKGDDEETSFIFTNDDFGVEADEFNPEEFLDVFCKAGRALCLSGHFYDANDEEYNFRSAAGDDSYRVGEDDDFNDELDEAAAAEETEESDEE